MTRWTVVAVFGLTLVPLVRPEREPVAVTIHMRSDASGGRVWFEPAGLRVTPGTEIQWVLEANVHTATAYHPANAGSPRRMPAGAEPWDSGYLVEPGATFRVRLTVPGVYDYYCAPHEAAGMVGRIVVGTGTEEPVSVGGTRAIPEAALAAFPPVTRIGLD